MAIFYQFTELSARDMSAFLFSDDNLKTFKWISTKLGMCIDIVEILFGIANGQISSMFTAFFAVTRPYFCFRTII